MWLTKTGDSSSIGRFAPFPITVLMLTSASVSQGMGASWAPRNSMSLKSGTDSRVSIAPSTLLPVSAMAWMSSMTPPSRLTRAGSTLMSGSTEEDALPLSGSAWNGASTWTDFPSSPMSSNADLGEWQRGHTQSSGRSSNLTPSYSSS